MNRLLTMILDPMKEQREEYLKQKIEMNRQQARKKLLTKQKRRVEYKTS